MSNSGAKRLKQVYTMMHGQKNIKISIHLVVRRTCKGIIPLINVENMAGIAQSV
jgi:hypothetical protein